MAVATGDSIGDVETRYDGAGYGQFKDDVGEAVVTLLAPYQERYRELRATSPSCSGCSRRAPGRRPRSADPTIQRMYDRMGFVRR
jgi:tryptophanyl-tRNA synthetase